MKTLFALVLLTAGCRGFQTKIILSVDKKDPVAHLDYGVKTEFTLPNGGK